MKSYIGKIGTLISQVINALVLGGNPDQSVSSRAYCNQYDSAIWCMTLIILDWLFYPIEKEHCRRSYETDVKWAQKILSE